MPTPAPAPGKSTSGIPGTHAPGPHAKPVTITAALLDVLLREHLEQRLPRYQRLWAYYRNPLSQVAVEAGGGQVPAQAMGLPPRLQRRTEASAASAAPAREQVIENDIAWRVHTLVDFMFGRSVALQSTAADPERAAVLERFLRAVFDANGGISFFQHLGLLGSVYGFVDVLVRVREEARPTTTARSLSQLARRVSLETIEAPRAVPVVDPEDYRRLDAYILHYRQQTHELEPGTLRQRVLGGAGGGRRAVIERTQLWTADHYAEFVGEGWEGGARPFAVLRNGVGRTSAGGARRLVETGSNRLGRVPVVHIQNLPQPFFYDGLSEIEPLIPLQDELNTRLSDRANRITFQSFKMYLGKGIDHFNDRPVGPGQMWATDNLDASTQEFGGDAAAPSESEHITEIREAMDKTSGVTPLAAGVLRDKIGNLTSENALRVTMMGLLAKTAKKRVAYGSGLEQLCELVLYAADVHGLLPSRPEERGVRLDWPDPLPASEAQQLQNARAKLEIGVPAKQVLTELGYPEAV